MVHPSATKLQTRKDTKGRACTDQDPPNMQNGREGGKEGGRRGACLGVTDRDEDFPAQDEAEKRTIFGVEGE